MKGFGKLFLKELKEVLTLQSLLGIVVSVGAFMLLGTFMKDIGSDIDKQMGSVVICDQDQSALSRESIDMLTASGMKIHMIDTAANDEMVKKAAEYDEHKSFLVIPKGFEQANLDGKPFNLQVVSGVTSFSIMSNQDASASSAVSIINDGISAKLIKQAGADTLPLDYIKSPVHTEEISVVGKNSASMNSTMLISFAMQQSIFIPIIVFLLITFSSQMNAAAIANEKNDKTLETLLSTPVSRLSVLVAKMSASGAFSLLMAGAFMLGFSSYMGGMMGGMGMEASGSSALSDALASLGLQLTSSDYILLGLQLFLTVLISLAISLILGALAKDLKAAQGLIMPLMFLAMIPYFLSMFTDINSLPTVARVLINLIPFTHTFTASANLLFGNMTLFYIGLAYQALFLAGMLFIAVRIFSTDKIFTMTLEFKKKKKVAAQ